MKSVLYEAKPRVHNGAPKVSADTSSLPPLPESCKAIVASIPRAERGDGRIRFLAEQLHTLSDDDRVALQEYMEVFIRKTHELDASDVDAGGPASNGYVWYRVHGEKRPYKEMGRRSDDEMNLLALNMLSASQVDVLFEEKAADFSWEIAIDDGWARFRGSLYFDTDSLALNMRAIAQTVRPLKSLGFHPMIEKGLMFQYVKDGLTLVTGVTGSGKSTTLDAIVDAHNHSVDAHVVIIGKPIEFRHSSDRCMIRHREVGKDVPSFKAGIVQALRQDPDVVVIGEMRDPATISAGLEITDSGHKVFSTLHTSSAVESIDRIIAEYPTAEQDRIRNRLADVLRCVVSQKLLPKLGGGRILAKEVLWVQASSRAAIKNDNTGEIYQMMWEGGSNGQYTLEQDLARLVRKRLISPETALSYANNKRRLQQVLGTNPTML